MIFNYINIRSNALRNGVIGLLGSPLIEPGSKDLYHKFMFSLEFTLPGLKE